MKFRSATIAALLATAPMVAGAATIDPADLKLSELRVQTDGTSPTSIPFTTISDDGVLPADGPTLTLGDSLDVTVQANGVDDTSAEFTFGISPLPVKGILEVNLTSNDFTAFGPVTIQLYSVDNIDPTLQVTQTLLGEETVSMASQATFTGIIDTSPLKIRYHWTNGVISDSFNSDINIAPVPVPAGILLMGTALAGFGVMRRRKNKAA